MATPPDPHTGLARLIDEADAAARAARPDRAVAALEKAVALAPGKPELWLNLGVMRRRAGDRPGAVLAFDEALGLRPGYGAAHFNRGNAHLQANNLADAAADFTAAQGAMPGNADVLANLADLHLRQGDAESARDTASGALAVDPAHGPALTVRGNALFRLGALAAARQDLRAALDALPDDGRAWMNLGAVEQALGDPAGALLRYHRAAQLAPGDAAIAVKRATAQLLAGDLAAGWAGYERRWDLPGYPDPRRRGPAVRWRGEPLAGQDLTVHAEQGFGDSIQFVRYGPALKDRGAGRVTLCCPDGLRRLMATAPGIDAVQGFDAPPPLSGLECTLMSLPGLFATTLETVPADGPYLSPDPDAQSRWRGQIGAGAALNVGLAWAGNPGQENDRNRSLPGGLLAPLTAVAGVRFHGLQVGPAGAQAPDGIIDLAPGFSDFAETAAALSVLDLIISADSAIAHLAGALGRPLWLMLCFDPDWRWLLGRDDSPWYPGARLFRQDAPGDWPGVIERLGEALGRRAAASR